VGLFPHDNVGSSGRERAHLHPGHDKGPGIYREIRKRRLVDYTGSGEQFPKAKRSLGGIENQLGRTFERIGEKWTAVGKKRNRATKSPQMPLLKYLADTNALSAIMRAEEPVVEWFSMRRDEVALSAVTLAELRAGIELTPRGRRRSELERKFEFVLEDYRGAILVFDESAAFEWGRLMAEARKHPLAYDDSMIAAIARSVGLRVVTRNVRDFPGCETVDPWTGVEYPGWPRPA
jgi:predicted nucleic acid-binding protein